MSSQKARRPGPRLRPADADSGDRISPGSVYDFREAFKHLQARRPDKYGADTRNPRWRLRPQ